MMKKLKLGSQNLELMIVDDGCFEVALATDKQIEVLSNENFTPPKGWRVNFGEPTPKHKNKTEYLIRVI